MDLCWGETRGGIQKESYEVEIKVARGNPEI
jgi:hypothetical protein